MNKDVQKVLTDMEFVIDSNNKQIRHEVLRKQTQILLIL